jgi:hypothetical protein
MVQRYETQRIIGVGFEKPHQHRTFLAVGRLATSGALIIVLRCKASIHQGIRGKMAINFGTSYCGGTQSMEVPKFIIQFLDLCRVGFINSTVIFVKAVYILNIIFLTF